MGLFDTLGDIFDAIYEAGDSSTHFLLECDELELFEIGTSWKGTARIHGAGEHIETKKVSYSTELIMPTEDDYDRSRRAILRDRLYKWASENFSDGRTLPKEAIVLNEYENCLSCEGFVKQVNSKWVITNKASEAKYYGAYKFYISKNGECLGNEDLEYYFKAETVARVSSVDVTEGF